MMSDGLSFFGGFAQGFASTAIPRMQEQRKKREAEERKAAREQRLREISAAYQKSLQGGTALDPDVFASALSEGVNLPHSVLAPEPEEQRPDLTEFFTQVKAPPGVVTAYTTGAITPRDAVLFGFNQGDEPEEYTTGMFQTLIDAGAFQGTPLEGEKADQILARYKVRKIFGVEAATPKKPETRDDWNQLDAFYKDQEWYPEFKALMQTDPTLGREFFKKMTGLDQPAEKTLSAKDQQVREDIFSSYPESVAQGVWFDYLTRATPEGDALNLYQDLLGKYSTGSLLYGKQATPEVQVRAAVESGWSPAAMGTFEGKLRRLAKMLYTGQFNIYEYQRRLAYLTEHFGPKGENENLGKSILKYLTEYEETGEDAD